MSTYWAEAQERYLRKTKQPLTYTGEKWASTTVNNILSFGLSMWNERNIILRGGTKAIARNIYRIDIQQQITKYYQSPTNHQILPITNTSHPTKTLQQTFQTTTTKTDREGYTFTQKLAQSIHSRSRRIEYS